MHKTLITPHALSQLLAGSEPPVVVDTRFSLADVEQGRRHYRRGHIPTAVYAHLDEDLSGPIIPGVTGRHPLPDPDALSARLGAWGISNARQVVAYDDADGGIAARLWWLLRWLGHDAVAVLDGGWRAWTAADLPFTTAIPAPEPADFQPALRTGQVVETQEVMAMRKDERARLVDSRTSDRFAGQNETIDPVAGHIPGAANLPYPDTARPDGSSLDPETLRSLFRKRLGNVDPGTIAFYCGSGVTAARNVLAMEHAGLPGSRLYAGSWSEWIQHSKEVEPE